MGYKWNATSLFQTGGSDNYLQCIFEKLQSKLCISLLGFSQVCAVHSYFANHQISLITVLNVIQLNFKAKMNLQSLFFNEVLLSFKSLYMCRLRK